MLFKIGGNKYISKVIKVDHPQITFKKYVEQLTSYRFRKGGSSGIYGSGGYWVEVDIARSIVREFEKNNFDTTYLISLLESLYKIARKDLPETKFVAKKEPSQTQRGELDIILVITTQKEKSLGPI